MSPMHTIDLTYVGRGIHEELVAYVADQEGYFEEEGRPRRRPRRHPLEHRAPARRRDHRPGPGPGVAADRRRRVDRRSAVNTHRPLFWFLGARRREVHGRPSRAPPRGPRPPHAARVLRPDRAAQARSGPRPRRAVLSREPRVTTRSDLRHLRDGSIDAAYVGSTLSPEQVADEEGFHGPGLGRRSLPDPHRGHRRGPRSYPARQPGAPGAGAGQPARPPHHRREAPGGPRLPRVVPRPGDPRGSSALPRALPRPYYTSDGRVGLSVVQRAVGAVAAELGVAAASVDPMYQPAA